MIEWCKRLNNSFTFLVIDWLPIRLIKLLINSFIILVIDWLPSRRGYLTKRWCSAGSRLCSCNLRHSAHNNNNPSQVFLLSPNVVGPQKNGTTDDSCVFFYQMVFWSDNTLAGSGYLNGNLKKKYDWTLVLSGIYIVHFDQFQRCNFKAF